MFSEDSGQPAQSDQPSSYTLKICCFFVQIGFDISCKLSDQAEGYNRCIYFTHVSDYLLTKIVLLEIYANKKQIKWAFDDTEAEVSVCLHKTCCGY